MLFNKIKLCFNLLLIQYTFSLGDLCTYTSNKTYSNLINTNSNYKSHLTEIANIPLPIWYTDRDSNSLNKITNALNNCESSLNTIIVYGLPGKDCDAGASSSGTNQNDAAYITFVNALSTEIANKEVIIILEPDAISLSMPGKCGLNNNFIPNIEKALSILSENCNAKIYLDIGYWNLIYGNDKIKQVLDIINKIDPNNVIKGFSLDLSNYRTTVESIKSCTDIRSVSGKDYHCIIDTSRNHNGPDTANSQWCNLLTAGMGELPTDKTNNAIIDYFLWMKPPGEVDGQCTGMSNSYQTSLQAGQFDINYFELLYKQGILNNGNTPTNAPSNIPTNAPSNIPTPKVQYFKGCVLVE